MVDETTVGETNLEEEKQEEQPQQEPAFNVEMDQDPVTVKDQGELTKENVELGFLNLLNLDEHELDIISQGYPNLDGPIGDEGRAWYASYIEGLNHLYGGASLSESVKRAGSMWKQKMELNGDKVGAGSPMFGSGEGGKISGEMAVMKITKEMGLGLPIQIPLWHTGIWGTINPPSERALLDLDRYMASEKVSLGRATNGMIYSNTSVYLVSRLVNFALGNLYESSMKNNNTDYLKNLIKVTDIPLLIWGLASSIYPSGYKYARACTTNPAKCQELVTGEVSLPKMLWVDNDSLSLAQKKHMANRGEKFSEEDLKTYAKEHVRGDERVITIKNGLKIRLSVPTVAQYERAGFSWVESTIRLLEGSLGVTLAENEREAYLEDHARVVTLRQYSHWVKSIETGDSIVEDFETIEKILDRFSSDEEISDQFFTEVGNYIDDSTIALVAIPKYKCPVCQGEQVGDVNETRHPHLLPIDPAKAFFTLLDQRTFKALTTRKL